MTTRIALVGPGAIGSTVAALLHAAGHPVLMCGRSPRPSIEVRPDPGIGWVGPIVLPGPVLTDPAAVDGPVDVVLPAVKGTQNADAASATIGQEADAGGARHERGRRRPTIGQEADAGGAGLVRRRTPVRLVLPDNPAAQRLAGVLRVPHLTVELDPDYVTETWRKLLTNAVAGLIVVTGRQSGMFRRDDVTDLARRYAAECLASPGPKAPTWATT